MGLGHSWDKETKLKVVLSSSAWRSCLLRRDEEGFGER